jgi:hypothetical protein
MPLLDRLLGRKNDGVPQLDLAVLQAGLTAALARCAGRTSEPDLVRARLADHCRDAGLQPVLPQEFDSLTQGFDDEAWSRLEILAAVLETGAVRTALPALPAAANPLELVSAAFVGLARDTALLTRELLRQSPLRVEELARRFVAALGAVVQGETEKVSRERLKRLDYGRLLADAERARQAAEGRMEQLRRLQDEQEKGRARRGKW